MAFGDRRWIQNHKTRERSKDDLLYGRMAVREFRTAEEANDGRYVNWDGFWLFSQENPSQTASTVRREMQVTYEEMDRWGRAHKADKPNRDVRRAIKWVNDGYLLDYFTTIRKWVEANSLELLQEWFWVDADTYNRWSRKFDEHLVHF